MATETDPVIIRIIASQRDLEKSLASSVRATERAAAKMEGALSGVSAKAGRKIGADAGKLGADAAASMKQANQAAGQLSFQLNDIATSMAGGMSPFQIMMQQGSQVAQVMQQIKAQGGSMGQVVVGAFSSMLNITSLVSFGLIALTGYAVKYFMESREGGKEAEKSLKEQRDLIRDVAQKWGDALPGLKAYNDELERQEDLQKQISALKGAVSGLTEGLGEALDTSGMDRISDAFTAFERFPKYRDDIAAWRKEWENFQSNVKDGNASLSQYNELQEHTNQLLNQLPMSSLDTLQARWLKAQEAITAYLERLIQVNAETKRLTDVSAQAADAINRMVPMPSIGAPVTGGAGVFNPSQTQLENAKKQREEAERAAEAAARELERATKENIRAAEQAAREAAEELNKAIVNQTSVAVDAVTGMLGMSENTNAAQINAFLKAGGVDLDSATQAWCAAFVNSALAQVGIKGSGSQVATSFLGWGQAVADRDVRRGDVLVQDRGLSPGETGGHVGMATGNIQTIGNEITKIEMISGNASGKVQQQWVHATSVIARRATDAFVLPAEALNHLSQESKRVAEETAKTAADQAARAQQLAQQISQMAQSAIGGLINDLRNGVDAGEAFNNMLNRIIDSLVQMALQSMFSPQGLGGLFSTILGGAVVKHGGGMAEAPGPMRMVPRNTFVNAKRYAAGGFAGVGPGEVPIIAHRGELIIPKNMMTRMQAQGGGAGDTTINDNSRIRIDMGSGIVAADSDSAKQFGQNVKHLIQQEMVRESRPGGLLRRVPG